MPHVPRHLPPGVHARKGSRPDVAHDFGIRANLGVGLEVIGAKGSELETLGLQFRHGYTRLLRITLRTSCALSGGSALRRYEAGVFESALANAAGVSVIAWANPAMNRIERGRIANKKKSGKANVSAACGKRER